MLDTRSVRVSPAIYFIFALIVLELTFGFGYVRGMKRISSEAKKEFDEKFYGIGIETWLNLYPSGLVVSEVYPGTPAKRAGIKKYDVILGINDGAAKFDRLEYISKSAAPVKLVIKRGDRIFKISVMPELMERKLIVAPVKFICTNCAIPYEVKKWNSE